MDINFQIKNQKPKIKEKRYLFAICFLIFAFVLPACSRHTPTTQEGQASKTLYHCAMHPQIISDKPGECPICHMQLVPIASGPSSPLPGERLVVSTSSVPGLAAVHLSPGIDQQIGVTVVPAQMRDLEVPIRAAAKVAYDPQLYSAAMEQQEANNFLNKAKTQGSADLIEQAQSTVHSSEIRLRQMGLSDTQISDIDNGSYDPSSLILGSKRGSLWVYASVFDYDASLIQRGQTVDLTSSAMPGKTYRGTVYALDPVLNNETRTLRVRIRISETDGSLRPEMYLSALIHARLGRRLAVPDTAVMDTGTRQIVYVQKSPGNYEPRDVRVGRRAGSDYEIVSGLTEGENVVTSANFLIDSESRIQAATQKALEQR